MRIKTFIAVIFLFFFIFGPNIDALPLSTARIVWFLMLFIIIIQIFKATKISFTISRKILIVSFSLIVLSLVAFGFNIVHNTTDYTIRNVFIGILIESLFGSVMYYWIFLRGKPLIYIFKLLVFVALLQAVFIFLMLFIAPLREFIFSLTQSTANEVFARYGGFRGLGFAHSTTYDLAMFMSITMMFISYFIIYPQTLQNTTRKSICISCWVFIWIILFAAVLMTGRSGLLGIFLSILLLLFGFKKYSTLKGIFYFSLFFIILGTTMHFIFSGNPVYERIFKFAFELFINFFQNGEFRTGSSDVLLNKMYFYPGDKTFLFGDGYWVDPTGVGYYMHTDAGFMRHILFYGIFSSVLFYLLYMYIFKNIFSLAYKNNILKILFISILIIFVAGHFKGSFLNASAMNIKLLMILFVYSIFYKSSKQRFLK
ncbi:MAG TPA: hypothetical protein K8U92_05430 [Aliarcobacter thereius]|nr:hypothetical protein [Aliarcobacter thereius]HJE03303.1 hypothetical protein [Aliarcobacter thereius]